MDVPEPRVRGVGRRLPFDAVSEPARAWVTRTVGDVVVAREHRGGMSPGCATSLRTTDGSLVFVEAVGAEAAVDLLTALGGSQTWDARQPDPPGLPHLATFCADDATRLLAAAEALS